MPTFTTSELTKPQCYTLLNGAIIPRPIAWVSTISDEGVHNLAPFSFFNAVAVMPPMVGFSLGLDDPERGLKDTCVNLKANGECVVNIVNAAVAQAVNITGTAFDPTTDEFVEAGVTPIPSELVRPMRVKESPIQFECKLHQIVTLENELGHSDLMICSVMLMHVNDAVYEGDYKIDQVKLDAVGRMGGAIYTHTRDTFTMARNHHVTDSKPS